MNELQNTKVFNAIPPAAIKDDADFVSNVIDTADLSYIEWELFLGATDIAMATLKIMQSDTKTDGTTLGGSPTQVMDATTKPGASDGGKVWILGVNLLAGHGRYMQLQAKAGNGTAGTFASAGARGVPKGNVSSLAADRGVAVAQYV